jgi:hypothetical protein
MTDGVAMQPGAWVVRCAWASVVLLAAAAVPEALGATAFDTVGVVVCLTLFLVSIPVWVYAFGKAVVRSARGDEIVVSSLFFLTGSAPKRVRAHLLGATGASVLVAAAVAFAEPFAVLVPMLPLGLTGLWGARYGTFPPRKPAARR